MRLRLWPTEDDPRQRRLRLLIACGSVVLLSLCILLYQEYGRVRGEGVSSWVTDVTADCGVVLTGGANRIREGIDLLAQRHIQKLIISGVNPKSNLREIFPLLPYYATVNEQDIILEKHSTTTYGNAQQSIALVEALRCRDVVLVTSSIHMYRALKTFKGAFPPQIPILPHSVHAGRGESGVPEVFFEATKSLFYSIWAY